jgi:hypothetical protein
VDPYAPPKSDLVDHEEAATGAEATRRALIAHEVQLKAVGTLCLFGVAFAGAWLYLLSVLAPVRQWWTYAVALAIAAALATLGVGFRRLRPWVRAPGTVLAVLAIAAVPVGTLMGPYVLYLMYCARGRAILAPGYAAVIAATPQVKYRRTIGDWIAIGFVIAILLALALTLVSAAR